MVKKVQQTQAQKVDQSIKDIEWKISDIRFVGKKDTKYYEKAKDEFELAKSALRNSKLNPKVEKDLLKSANRFLARAIIYLDASKNHYSQPVVEGMLTVHSEAGPTGTPTLPKKPEKNRDWSRAS